MTTAEKWNVKLGDKLEPISKDLLIILGFQSPYSDDPERKARDKDVFGSYHDETSTMAEAYASGFCGDEAAMYAIRLRNERSAAQRILGSKLKIAEAERAAAEAMQQEAIVRRSIQMNAK